jgi:hypothetical protein
LNDGSSALVFDAPGDETDAAFALNAKLWQAEIADVVEVVRSGGSLPRPVVVDLDPTTACDLACPECISQDVLHTKRFSNERLKSLAEECVALGVRGVVLIGGGEPLLHTGTRNAVATLADGGVSVGLVTNGTLLARYDDLFADTLSWLRISLDAGTRETYERVRPARGGRDDVFDLVMTNLERAATTYRGRVGASYVLFSSRTADEGCSSNIGEVLEAASAVKAAGASYLELKPELDAGHRIVELTSKDHALLRAQAPELARLQSDTFRVIASSGLRTLLSTSFDATEPKSYHECPVAELRTLITPHGAYVCAYHRGREAAKLGDPSVTPLRELWAGDARRSRIDPSATCRFHCAHHEQNRALHGESSPVAPAATEGRGLDPFL